MSTRPSRILAVAANPSVDRLYEVERLTPGEIHRPVLVAPRAGGKGLNVARAAVALGVRVTAVGIVGGRSGDWIVEALAAAGVDAAMARTAAESRTCLSILDRGSGELTELYERGEPVEARAWAELEAIVARELERGGVAAVTLSGSLPLGVGPDGYARIARIASAAGVPVLADVAGAPLEPLLREEPALLKVNATEAGAAAGIAVTDAGTALEAAWRLRRAGAGEVVVTLGRAGAAVLAREGETVLPPPTTFGRYPVGSGDAFLAGLAVGRAGGLPLDEAARLGAAAGAANAAIPGAGDLDPATLEALR